MNQQNTIEASSERLHIVELVRKWADVNTDGILDKTTQHFFCSSH